MKKVKQIHFKSKIGCKQCFIMTRMSDNSEFSVPAGGAGIL